MPPKKLRTVGSSILSVSVVQAAATPRPAAIIPPKTPICNVVMPSIEVVELAAMASTPPLALIMALMAVFMTR